MSRCPGGQNPAARCLSGHTVCWSERLTVPDAVVLNRVRRRSRDDYYCARYVSMYAKADAYRSESAVNLSKSTIDQY